MSKTQRRESCPVDLNSIDMPKRYRPVFEKFDQMKEAMALANHAHPCSCVSTMQRTSTSWQ